jgi:Phage integrase family
MEELISWRALQTNISPDELVFSTTGGSQRDKDNVRKRLGSVVKETNSRRAERDLPALPTVSPHALRRTYISLLIEAGAPLPYVMRQVGHEDSRTALEVYAQVQRRLSRTRIHQAFDELLAGAGGLGEVPTGCREKMSDTAQHRICQRSFGTEQRTVRAAWSAQLVRATEIGPEDDAQPIQPSQKPREARPFGVELAGLEPATS